MRRMSQLHLCPHAWLAAFRSGRILRRGPRNRGGGWHLVGPQRTDGRTGGAVYAVASSSPRSVPIPLWQRATLLCPCTASAHIRLIAARTVPSSALYGDIVRLPSRRIQPAPMTCIAHQFAGEAGGRSRGASHPGEDRYGERTAAGGTHGSGLPGLPLVFRRPALSLADGAPPFYSRDDECGAP